MFNEKLAIIGGSRAYDLLKTDPFGPDLQYTQIVTPFGDSGTIHRFVSPELNFLFLSRHGDESYSVTAPFVNYRANIWALKECGVERILSWSGPGIINTRLKPGQLAIPHDLIDETKDRPSTFFDNSGLGFIRQGEPFCPQIRETLRLKLKSESMEFGSEGVYVCTQGPRLETKAEIRMFKQWGADLVGMTLIPEVFLARELEMCYGSLCYLTNYAEGIQERPSEPDVLFGGMSSEQENQEVEKTVIRLPSIARSCLIYLNGLDRDCHCKDSMSRYKQQGIIGDDWHTWIQPVR